MVVCEGISKHIQNIELSIDMKLLNKKFKARDLISDIVAILTSSF